MKLVKNISKVMVVSRNTCSGYWEGLLNGLKKTLEISGKVFS